MSFVPTGLEHPAFGEPAFAAFLGSDEFLSFVDGWCTGGLRPQDGVFHDTFLLCNPRKHEKRASWHRKMSTLSRFVALSVSLTRNGSLCTGDVAWNRGGDTVAGYSEEVERELWAQVQQRNRDALSRRDGVGIFLALTEDECHEVVDTSHERFRTALEHDVLLPQAMKDKGVPFVPSWDGASRLPGQVSALAPPNIQHPPLPGGWEET